ncbi:hypothetical protein GUJ93_ZPchr0003g17987 [Zizania palustris]|uniref:Uncharacterized protein n=1 Tax=Zizania palustris TaxID=103762 RepID=A0A8J5VWI1_ZIZPA|nr:hypothetical protein GUJ93_ZPchr0003g17987 [Zizania palustris]
MDPTVELRLGRRRSTAAKGRGGSSGHGEVPMSAPTEPTSPRTPSTSQSQQCRLQLPIPAGVATSATKSVMELLSTKWFCESR